MRLLLLKSRVEVQVRRMTTRPALGPCVSFKLDEDTHLKLVNAKERSGRSKAGEVVLRVKDHLLRYPDFYPTVTYKSVSFGPVVMARFDEDTNKKLIAAKNKVTEASRMKFIFVSKHICSNFLIFIVLKSK